MPLDQVSTLGRVTQGVRLIHLKNNQTVSTISLVDHEEEDTLNEVLDDDNSINNE